MKLSVIVTVYNIEEYIEKCLFSIQNQTFKDYQCIVINDGSTDNSASVISTFQNDSRFVILKKENGGVSSARNVGIDIAEGEYIIFVDGDDYLDLTMLENLVKILEYHKVDAIFSGYKGIYDTGEVANIEIPFYDKKIYEGKEIKQMIANFIGYSYEDLYKKLNGEGDDVKREFAAVWRFVYKTQLIKDNKLYFDERIKFGEDILFNSVYLSLCKCLYISDRSDYNYIYRKTGLVQTFLHADGEKLLEHKLILMQARQEATDSIMKKCEIDISDMWLGSIIFSSMHIALTLVSINEDSFINRYKLFIKYAKNQVCKKAYSKLELGKLNLKYKLCFIFMKLNLYFLEFLLLSLATKIGITPDVEG